jgi:flagellar assembly factor FliW
LEREITTKHCGTVTIKEEDIFQFPEGVFGFDTVRQFVFIEEKDSPMMWMQAVTESELAFVVLDVLDFMDEYDLSISQSDLLGVKAKSPKELTVYAIITIPQDDPSKMTANLMGPVIINKGDKIGRQVISHNDSYKTKHNVLDLLKSKNEQKGA